MNYEKLLRAYICHVRESEGHFGSEDRTLEQELGLAGGPYVGRLLREAIALAAKK